MINSPPNLVRVAEKRGMKKESLDALLDDSKTILLLLMQYIEEHHSKAVFKDKISALKLDVTNYAVSQAYANGQIKQAANILSFLRTLTKET